MGKTSTSWVQGQSGNPEGRPRGSRDTVTKAFLRAARGVEKEEEVKNRERRDEGEEYEVRNRGGSSVGVYILVWLGIIFLVLILLDRFVLEGKILDWFFGQLKLKGQSQRTEEEDTSMFFEGRSL